MTDERKNEIWAFLTPEEKAKYSKEYLSQTEDDWDSGYEAALQNIFGRHNIAAQAEDGNHNLSQRVANCDKSVETSTKEDAYFAYRLDLAKEIAVAMINTPSSYGHIAMIAVETANEIVKRLKETEE